jgi:hypothetical protein
VLVEHDASGSTPASSGFSRSTRAQKAWIVEICAPSSSRWTRVQCGRVASSARRARRDDLADLPLHLAAAFSVNVMARTWPTSRPGRRGGGGARSGARGRPSSRIRRRRARRRSPRPRSRALARRWAATAQPPAARLLLERRPLEAARRTVRAVRVARIGIDVEAAVARAANERHDARGDPVELGAPKRRTCGVADREQRQIPALEDDVLR